MMAARWVAIPRDRRFTLATVAAKGRDLKQVLIKRHHVGVEPHVEAPVAWRRQERERLDLYLDSGLVVNLLDQTLRGVRRVAGAGRTSRQRYGQDWTR
jgi:hypothetical protein